MLYCWNVGKVTSQGAASDIVAEYLTNGPGQNVSLADRSDRHGTGQVRVTKISVRDTKGNPIDVVCSGQDIEMVLDFVAEPGFFARNLAVSIDVSTGFEVPVFVNHNRLTGDAFGPLPERGRFVCQLPRLPLPPATFRVSYSVLVNDRYIDGPEQCGGIDGGRREVLSIG